MATDTLKSDTGASGAAGRTVRRLPARQRRPERPRRTPGGDVAALRRLPDHPEPAERRCTGRRHRDPRVRRHLRHRVGGHRPVRRLGGRAVRDGPRLVGHLTGSAGLAGARPRRRHRHRLRLRQRGPRLVRQTATVHRDARDAVHRAGSVPGHLPGQADRLPRPGLRARRHARWLAARPRPRDGRDGTDRGADPRPYLHRPFDVRDRRQRGGGPALRTARQAAEAGHLRPLRALRRGRGHRPRLPADLRAAAGRAGVRTRRDRRGRHRRRQPRRMVSARRPAH